MPIDPRIALGVQPFQIPQQDPNAQMNALARVMQMKTMRDESDMNALKMEEYKRGVTEQNQLRSEMSGGADPYNALLKFGRVKEATEFAKGKADVAKTTADIESKQLEAAHKRIEVWGQAMGHVRQNPTAENAMAAVQHLVTMGVIPREKAQDALVGVQNDPKSIADWATRGYQTALQAKDQLPKYETRNTGGTTDTMSIDPVTGKVAVVNSVRNTQTPDNVATNARIAADNAASRAQSERHHQAGQGGVEYVQTPEGLLALPKKPAAGQPISGTPVTVGGQPASGKPSAAVEKELVGIRQQNAIIDGALKAVDATPAAFSFGRGTATMAGAIPESVAGRFDSDAERQARSYVFNNVSKVINERAGAAQSAQELARLRSFLPAETDNADQIKSKLNAFKTYLSDMESGTTGKPAKAATGNGFSDPAKESRYQEWKRKQGAKP